MSFLKIITGINWVLIGIYGALVLYMLSLQNTGRGHEIKDLESIVKGLGVFLLIVLIGLNWLPYQWTKIVTLLLVALIFWIISAFAFD